MCSRAVGLDMLDGVVRFQSRHRSYMSSEGEQSGKCL